MQFAASLSKLVLEGKNSICSTVKENLFFIVVSFRHLLPLSQFNIFLKQGLYHKEAPLIIESINFITESLAFQIRHLNGAHSISNIKLPCKNRALLFEITEHISKM